MENNRSGDANNILDLLKKKAESDSNEPSANAQTTESVSRTDDELKAMLKAQYNIEGPVSFQSEDDYSFVDISDFEKTGEIAVVTDENTAEEVVEETAEESVEEIAEEVAEVEEVVEETTVSETESEEIAIEETAIEETESEEIVNEEPADEAITDDEESEELDEVDEVIESVISETEELIDDTVQEITQTQEAEEIQLSFVIEEKSENSAFEDATEEVEQATEEVTEEATEEVTEEVTEEIIEESDAPVESFEAEKTMIFSAMPAPEKEANSENEGQEEAFEKADDEKTEYTEEENYIKPADEIDYESVAQGQQGTVFNSFVEDISGDLDDVVFEAEITESQEPEKQFTIFEDWQKMMLEKQYETAEEGIIPPTKEELEYSAELAAKNAAGKTDYFPSATVDSNMDAVDIALMVALGGENELNQTVGFEKIRQAVNEEGGEDAPSLDKKGIYGYCGEEYTTPAQNSKIKRKYKSEKTKLILKASATAIITLLLFIYEIAGWMGAEFSGILSISEHPELHVLVGLQLLVIALIISAGKFKRFLKSMLEFSSISFIGAITVSLVSIIHDILIIFFSYTSAGATMHSLAALLLLISLVYDIFDVYQQSGIFDIISDAQKKITFEPYGKLRMGEDEQGDVIDKDSYCISKTSNISKFFSRQAKQTQSATGKLISLVLSFSVSLVVMLVLTLIGEQMGVIVLSLIVTLSFSLLCASIFESEFAFFAVFYILKKYRTGIIGKSTVSEYGKCNIVYFDDFNVFNKRSVRTKGLKVYDNAEIYRILYHTQAVFSKIGGPLKGVFEFATSEMKHSEHVEIKEVNKEGISALVDGRTAVLIGTGSFMKSKGIHPRYTAQDIKAEEEEDDSIMFIALNGMLGAKLYVTYRFSSEFERLAKKLISCGVNIGIRSYDPNINDKWAKKYGDAKKCSISVVRPTPKEIKRVERSVEGAIVSSKNVRALAEALMMCIKLDSFESFISKLRIVAILLIGALTFVLVLFSGINAVSMLLLLLCCAFGASIMTLLSYFYIKR